MRTNRTLEKLRRGEAVFGCAIQWYRSPPVVKTLAAAGFDYVFIDLEHGGFDLETVQDMVEAAVAASITPLVRVGELLYSLVARALDVGAQGIVLPRVDDPGLLRQALRWMKFPPEGCRGFGVLPPLVDFAAEPMAAIMDHLNRHTMSVVQFESLTALERAEELLAIEGVDVAMVGPADLSVSLGLPGQFSHPELVEAIRRFIRQCERAGVAPGIHCRDPEQARFWVEQGMRFVGAGGEHRLLLERAREVVTQLHGLLKRAPAPARSAQ
ncbi:MAG: aldolase/citrate lyase family protein [Bryobacterales bacterium]|nr:aldolase/citrate lyase family protein [Bryobacteraceae bacterium]MDW8131225.1 aldolase/citrate lyase family protein [Bryobacterales bacterium]